MTISSRSAALRRTGLLASTALFMLSGATAAVAQDRDALLDAMNGERADGAQHRDRVLDALDATFDPQSLVGRAHIAPIEGQETPSIAINNNIPVADRFDPVNVTGIGQVISDSGGGFIGTCTGTLINRRTIIFAAHCVNNRPATAYGALPGNAPGSGVGIGVGFETNTRANAAGQPDELLNWLTGGSTGPGRFRSNTAQNFYNINQVLYDPRSLAPASCTVPGSCFLEADIALGVLDTPANRVPTWTMLFSPLASPATIDPATGTGYHVTIAGYGNTGNGTTGAVPNSGGFRRRIAENILGGLTSIDTRNLFLFGSAGTPSRPQLLYWIDFDDPARGTAAANPRDFNGFRDNALPREGTTGPGDSGGPLVIDQAFGANVRTIVGVLSGGSTFFTGQPGGSYGTQSFYQPLFLYWDWIVANNPYRYVTATAGNKNWEDPTAWVTTLDPAYQVLLNGMLANGIPTNLGGANTVTTPQFGELCFQSPSSSPNPATNECENLATGAPRNGVPNTPTGTADVSAPDTVDLFAEETDGAATEQVQAQTASASEGSGANRGLDGAFESPNAFSPVVNPAPTLANGLPGATNFVPNNSNPVRATGVPARYYDVTLRNAGIVTLNSNVTIDNFAIAGAQSQLTVATGASLTSLFEVNHMTGIVNVNGTINSAGDYFFLSGLLTGSGRVNAPFLTSVMGNFAPGTLGTVGTLTVGGNLVMASGSTYAVDIGPNLASDRIAVVAGSGSTGIANVGGRVIVTPTAGTIVRFGDLYTILTAAGGVGGAFISTDISAILRQQFVYNANSVQLRINAVPFAGVVNQASTGQRALASLLDRNRNDGAPRGLFDVLDLQNQATIQATLENLIPRVETLRTAIGITALDNSSRVIRDRLGALEPGDFAGGTLAYYGRRIETAAMSLAGMNNAGTTMSDVSVQEDVRPVRLPETMAAFVAAGYLEGESVPMVGNLPVAGSDQFDGFYVTAGIEHELDATGVAGIALSYTDLDGETAAGGQSAEGRLYQATLYGKKELGRFYLDTQIAMGLLEIDTDRPGNLPNQPGTLSSSDNSLTLTGEVGLGAMFGDRFQFGPRVAGRVSYIDFSKIIETGGVAALEIDRNDYRSIEGRAGLVARGTGRIRPNVTATYVHEFLDRSAGFGANFIGGVGGNALFNLAGQDKDWFEVAGGLAIDLGRVELSVSADTTIERDDVENQSYRAGVRIRF